MEIEQLEIRDYLALCPPLDRLGEAVLDEITQQLEISYTRRGRELLKIDEINNTLYLIRTGAMAVYDAEGNLQGQFCEGDWVGYRSLLSDGKIGLSVRAVEDSLLYMIPADIFNKLCEEHPFFKNFFSMKKQERLRNAINDMQKGYSNNLSATTVKDLIHRHPLITDESTSIAQVAREMTDEGYTVMLITRQGQLIGIVTDRAYCTKVASNNISLQQPISDIMTDNPLTITIENLASDALLMMARHNIRHLPVMEREKIIGVVTATDLIRYQSHNTLYLINEIHRAENIHELQAFSHQLPATFVSLVNHNLATYDIGHAISSVGGAINQRLLQFAEKKLGPPPVPYAWIVAGSLARNEQTVFSDQDNAIILSDDYEASLHGEYFEQLSQMVSDGLNTCGYHYCPGNVMATNPKWRQPVSSWHQYFNKWIDEPEPMALMYSSIFFDLRCVYGDASLLEEVQEKIYKRSRISSIFLGLLTANALKYTPPIGFFRNFVLEKTGEEKKALDLKKRGTVPIIDLARVYALSAGDPALHTQDRLEAGCKAGKLSQDGMEDLKDALEFITSVRLRHQAYQISNGLELDNFVVPEQLTSLERRHLKDAFDVVHTIQSVMAQRQ